MKNYIALIILILTLSACDDIIEKDISNETVTVISPPDQFVPSSTTVNFLWDFVDGADEYQLEVVRGRFDSIVAFVLDTFVTVNQFTANFTPGEYQWSLRAINSEYSTGFVTRTFRIDSTTNIGLSTLILSFPADGSVFPDSALTLSWEELFGATQYIVRVSDRSTGNIVINDTTSNSFYFTDNVLRTNTYDWGVKAINEDSETAFSASSFEIDQISPSQPVLISPTNTVLTSVGPSVQFDWQSELDNNGAFDSIFIRLDTVGSLPLVFQVTQSSFISDSLATATYLWRVKSIDKAGNESALSEEWTFNVQ